jgi:hypothetical protein
MNRVDLDGQDDYRYDDEIGKFILMDKTKEASFIILYRIVDQVKPEEYDYTHNYKP